MLKVKRCILSLALIFTTIFSANICVFASESDVSEKHTPIEFQSNNISPYGMVDITTFTEAPTGYIDVPFHISNANLPVKVLFSAKYVDGSTWSGSMSIRKASSSVWFWNKSNVSNQPIEYVGYLATGDYVLRIKANNLYKQFAISGKVYYME